jgi:membrane protease YdiL (CAAX protease family)
VRSRAADRALLLGVLATWLAGAAASRWFGLWLGLGGVAIVLGAALALVDGRRRRRPVLGVAARPVAAGLVVGVISAAVTGPLYAAVARAVPGLAAEVDRLYAHLGATSPALASLALTVVVLAEEAVWRGWVQGALERQFGANASVPLTAALYGLALAPAGSPLLVLVAFACGLVWSALRAGTRSLIAPVLAHLLWDHVVLLLAPLTGR